VIVQNLPVPLDRRVWLECLALRSSGHEVSVICPKGPNDPDFEEIDGVRIHKYRPAPEVDGPLGYVREFVQSWVATARRSRRVWRDRPFAVIQACNPPDTYWALARLWRHRGVLFVYDQHDLNPELFLSRFGVPTGILGKVQYRGLTWLELRTYRAAHHVISTNESYRRTAIERGRLDPSDVTVVRSGPDTARMRPIDVRPPDGGTAGQELVYLGIMGPQDGVDVLLDAMDHLVHVQRRTNVHLSLLGFGDCYDELRAQATRLGLDPYVTFTGRADRRMIAEHLSAADIGVCPDPYSPLNDVSTMNKTMEYMAYALPVVAFDLTETRVSAGDTAVYVEPGDITGFATAITQLLDDDERREQLGVMARERVADKLDWQAQRLAYVGVFNRLLGRPTDPGVPTAWPGVERRARSEVARDEWGNALVDLRSATGLRDFLRRKSVRAGR
jgi:glycosyltransferase involved in cell wall biosynthesis